MFSSKTGLRVPCLQQLPIAAKAVPVQSVMAQSLLHKRSIEYGVQTSCSPEHQSHRIAHQQTPIKQL